jgi:phage-related protein
VSAIICYTRSPKRLDAKHPLLIEDLLKLAYAGRQGCVTGIVKMIADLYEQGESCRYIKALGGALYELKTRTPTGGARVYFFRGAHQEFVLCRAECKREKAASLTLLESTAEILEAHLAGIPVTQGGSHEEK